MINKKPKYDAPAILVIVRDTFLFTIPWTINISSARVAKAKYITENELKFLSAPDFFTWKNTPIIPINIDTYPKISAPDHKLTSSFLHSSQS